MTEPTTMICHDCGEQFPTSEMTIVEGGAHNICPDCIEDNYAQCEKCGQWSQRGYTGPASEFLCDACAAEIEAEPTLDENGRMSQLNEQEFMEGFNIAAPGYYDYTDQKIDDLDAYLASFLRYESAKFVSCLEVEFI